MRARLIVVAAFVSAAAVPGLLAYGSGIIPSRGATSHDAQYASAEFRVTALAWPDGGLGLAATPERVVWEQRTTQRATRGLWAYEVGEQRAYRLLASPYVGRGSGFPSASGSTVVWVVRTSAGGPAATLVRGYDSLTGRRFVVAARGTAPTATGDVVVWIDASGRHGQPGTTMIGRDLVTDRRFVLRTRVSAHAVVARGSWVVWRAGSGAGTQVWAADRGSGRRYRLSGSGTAIATDTQRALWAARVSPDESAIMAWDLLSHHTAELCRVPGRITDLAADDDLAVWVQDTGNGDVWAYDLARGRAVPVCTGPAAQTSPVIVGHTVFWADRRSGRWELYGRALQP